MRLDSDSMRLMAVPTASSVGNAPDGRAPVTADTHQRGTQLVRGVAYEAPHLRLALLTGLKERLNLSEHGVQRDGEVTNLVVRVVVLDALGKVAGGNLGGGLFNAARAARRYASQSPTSWRWPRLGWRVQTRR